MASGITIIFRPAMIRANAGGSGRDPSKRMNTSSGGNAAWLSPLFGWTVQPDYIDCSNTSLPEKYLTMEDRRISARGFTEEKAREMRRRMMETKSFHDPMYHSVIASRLASDFRRKS